MHISDVERSGLSGLRENQRISFDLKQDNRGKMSATNLQAVEAEGSAEPANEQPANDQTANDQTAEAPAGEAE